MTALTPLQTCLDAALAGHAPVPSQDVALADAVGGVLAQDLCLPLDMPPQGEALRAGFAVAALDLLGASASMPVPLGDRARVAPGDRLPAGCDAVLPFEATEDHGMGPEALRPVHPGEGARHAGHDGRLGTVLGAAGTVFTARVRFMAALTGLSAVSLRRPTLRVMLDDPAQAAFVADWGQAMGARTTQTTADLTVRPVTDHAPRLAFAPAETAWLSRGEAGLVLQVPARFDGLVAALLGLGQPALATLSGARPRLQTRPIRRKISSAVGVSELVLLAEDGDGWRPAAPGIVTLTALAEAQAFATLPPQSEGLPAGAMLTALPIDQPFE